MWFVHHHCVYCDSRSECYGIDGFDREILVKVNAIDLLRDELSRKRFRGVIGLGSMNDPFMPIEKEINLAGRALAVIAEFGFAVHIIYCQITPSNGIKLASGCSGQPGMCVRITLPLAR